MTETLQAIPEPQAWAAQPQKGKPETWPVEATWQNQSLGPEPC
jgi:hypothetical protein